MEKNKVKKRGYIRKSGENSWQGVLSYGGKPYYVYGMSEQEIEEKLKICFKAIDNTDFIVSIENLNILLKQNGFIVGIKGKIPTSIRKIRENYWRGYVSLSGKKHHLYAASQIELKSKIEKAIERYHQGSCLEVSSDWIDLVLKEEGFSSGRFSCKKKSEKEKKKHSAFKDGIRLRSEGRWEGRYYYQGKQYSIYADTREYAQFLLKKISDSIKDGSYTTPSKHTVSSWLEKWYKEYAITTLRPSTFVNYKSIIRNHINPSLGKFHIHNVSVDILQNFFISKLTLGRCDGQKGGLSIKTIKKIKRVMNRAFSQAYFNRIIDYNPVEGVKLPVSERVEQKVLNQEEKTKLLKQTVKNNDIYSKAIILLLQCGLRKGEISGLLWENVNFTENYIKVKYTLSRLEKFEINSNTNHFIRVDMYAPHKNKTAIYLGPVKTKKANRIIYMPKTVRDALFHIKLLQAEHKKKDIDLNFVICKNNGCPIDPRIFEEKFHKLLFQVGLRKINIHATRHTFATEALSKSTDFLTISEILGHATPSTTLDMYGHTFAYRKKALMECFE